MNRGIIWGTLATAVCVSNAAWWLYSRKPTTTPEPKSDAAAIRELRRELGELKEARATDLLVAARLANAAPAPAPEPSPTSLPTPVQDPSEVAPSRALSDAEQEQEAAKAEAAILTRLEQSFANERPDGRWSGATTNEIARALPATLPKGSNVSAVNCKSHTCRVETTHESVESFREFNTSAFARSAQAIWKGGVYSAVREHSTRGVVALTYLAKEGEELPLITSDE